MKLEPFLERVRAAKGGRPQASPSPSPDAFPAATGAAELGLNTVIFYDERKYAQPREVILDMQRLGVRVLRQPGRLQMYLSHLLYEQEPGEAVPLTKLQWRVQVTPDLMTMSTLRERVTSSFCLRWLLAVCQRMTLLGVDQKLLVTFLDFGEGAPTDWSDVDGGRPADGPGGEGTQVNPVGLRWAPGHIGQSISDWTKGEDVAFSTGSGVPWDTYTLDPSNAYKRTFYAMIASILGDWFQRHQTELSPHLQGIEIGNEQETFHARVDGGRELADGDAWGRLYYDCAAAFRARCDWVPLWLPALASARPDGDGQEAYYWPGKVEFVRGMLTTIQAQCAEWSEFELHELVAGVDYHYYNMFPDDARPLHFMALQLRELRELVERDFVWTGGSVPRVTCFETGVNVLCMGEGEPGFETLYTKILSGHEVDCEDGAVAVTKALALSFGGGVVPSDRPPVWASYTTGALAFQAQSVWMRLGVARAAAADIVGWHCHIGNRGSAFAGTGIRYDFQDGGDDPSTAGMRPSWYALREFGRWLVPATTVRVLSPGVLDGLSWGEFFRDFEAGALLPADMLWIIEFEGGPVPGLSAGWSYLCFLDPGWPSATSSAGRPVEARLVFQCERVRPRVFQLDTVPYESPTTLSSTKGRFPEQRWSPVLPAKQTITRVGRIFRTAEISLGLGMSPLLLLSSRQLSVASSEVVTA